MTACVWPTAQANHEEKKKKEKTKQKTYLSAVQEQQGK